MGFREPQTPGIGGLKELTASEQLFVQNLAALSYATGDILYYDGTKLNKLAIGSSTNVLTVSGGLPAWAAAGGGGSGSVTTVSVATANGFSGTVTNPTTTPAITIIAGAITPTSVNGLTISTTTGTLSITNGKTLSVSNTITFAGTDSTTMTFPTTSATLARTDAANTFVGHQTIEGVTSTGATGSGKFVFDTSPTIVTPTIASFANATHNHTNSAGGGQLTDAALSAAVTPAKGGTGLATLTAYAILTAGTTSTGTFQQVSGVGTSGQVLTSNGAAALPTWQTLTSSATTSKTRRDVWVFPDSTINAATDIAANDWFAIKPMWYEVNVSGALVQRNSSGFGSNFYYTTANALIVRQNSTEQYVCVALANAAWMDTLCSDATKRATAIAALLAFVQLEQFTGVELDWEDFGSWTSGQYANFKIFVTELGNTLQANGFKLMIDLPPIWNNSTSSTANEWTSRNSQGYYQLKYEDFDTLPVDYLVPMAYDYQFDIGAGSPNSPLLWARDVSNWIYSKITNKNRIIMGLPSAGYSGTTGGFTPTGRTYTYLAAQTGFGGASRDSASGELIWANAGTSYAAMDDTSMNTKITSVEAYSVNRVSLWHGGDNKYGSGRQYIKDPDPAVTTKLPSGSIWTTVTATSQAAAVGYSYITNNASLVTVTLPSSAVIGQMIHIQGSGAGGWKLAQNASQLINFGNQVTTTGTGGSLASTNRYDAITVVCTGTNTTWAVVNAVGNLTVV